MDTMRMHETFDRLDDWIYANLDGPFAIAILTFAAIALVVVVGLIVRWVTPIRDRRRERQLESLASFLGLDFAPAGAPEAPNDQFAKAGISCYSEDEGVIHGQVKGRRVLVFGRAHPGENVSDQRALHSWSHMSLVIAHLELQVPSLVIRPERLEDKISGALGLDDIDFDTNREFSTRFYVYCREESFARALITPQVMTYLQEHPGWTIDLRGQDALIYDTNIWKPERFEAALKVLTGFLDRIPQLEWHSQPRPQRLDGRQLDLKALADELGFNFSTATEPLRACAGLVNITVPGWNILRGSIQGRPCMMFDCEIDTTAVVALVDRSLSHLNVLPQEPLDGADALLTGREDIGLEGDAFTRSFVVNCQDRKFAYAVLTPRVMELMLNHRFWCLETCGQAIMVCKNHRLAPEELETGLRYLTELLDLIPPYLLRDRRAGDGTAGG